ncbi:sulfotransferase domain-containing protein [Pelagibacteraceae bacterium]|nr:sulfotransferase domain-containing protein [Pelagibacteraceae bacterium]
MKLLHIGLGKCGSTFLQKEIFPRLAKKVKSNYINFLTNDFFKIDSNKVETHHLENLKNLEKLLPEKFILSNESLFSYHWEFSRINESFENIKKNFSENTVILIVIRNPYDLLNSIYTQSIQHMRIIKSENFFYIDKNERGVRIKNRFNLYAFDYQKLISLYKTYFKNVVVVKYEDLNKFDFLKEIYDLDNSFIRELQSINAKHHKSISKFGIKFIIFLNSFIDVEKNQLLIRSLIKRNKDLNIIDKIRNKILRYLILNSFFQNSFDKIIPYKKFCIQKKFIPIDIDYEIKKYKLLKI